jgi:hypothetical protein
MPRAEDAKDATDSKRRVPVEAEAGRRRAFATADRPRITNHQSLLSEPAAVLGVWAQGCDVDLDFKALVGLRSELLIIRSSQDPNLDGCLSEAKCHASPGA